MGILFDILDLFFFLQHRIKIRMKGICAGRNYLKTQVVGSRFYDIFIKKSRDWNFYS